MVNAKRSKVVNDEGNFKIYLNAPAVEGKANKALIEVLAGYFSVKKSQVVILKGEKSRNKIVEILNEHCKCN